MRFKDWIKREGRIQNSVARDLGYSKEWISQVVNNAVKVHPRLVKLINDYTRGEVTAEDLKKKIDKTE